MIWVFGAAHVTTLLVLKGAGVVVGVADQALDAVTVDLAGLVDQGLGVLSMASSALVQTM